MVAHTSMKLTGLSVVTICPWAIREGVLLRQIEDGRSWWAKINSLDEAPDPPDPLPLRIAAPTR